MLHFRQKLVRMFFIAMAVFRTTSANAQSTVYLFMRSTNCFGEGGGTTVTINGKDSFDMRGPFKKTMGNVANPSLPLFMYHASQKKCILKEEGKVLFAVDYNWTNGSGKTSDITAEIQLNLTEGFVHYIQIVPKGLNDLQFKILDEKKAAKLMKDKDYVSLPDYIEE